MIAAPETKITAGMTQILFCDPRCFLPLLSFRFYLSAFIFPLLSFAWTVQNSRHAKDLLKTNASGTFPA
jgi:hypothetical protein